jgi:hypothetical protein
MNDAPILSPPRATSPLSSRPFSGDGFGQVEETAEVGRGHARHLLEVGAPGAGDDTGDVREMRGFVPPPARTGTEVAWEKVRTVGLDDETLARDAGDEGRKVGAAPLVGDPAGEPDEEALLEDRVELVGVAREAVDEGVARGQSGLAPEGEEVGEGVAHVEEKGAAAAASDRELSDESPLLLGAGGEKPEIVEPALADAHHPGAFEKVLEVTGALLRPGSGVVGMNARRRPDPLRVSFVERLALAALLERRTGHEEPRNPAGSCAREDRLPVGFVTLVGEVRAGVEEKRTVHGHSDVHER